MNDNSNSTILVVILLVVIAIGGFLLYRDSQKEMPNDNGASLEINLGGENDTSSSN